MDRIDRDAYRLSSGREVKVNHGLISLAADIAAPLGYGAGDTIAGFELGEGYDGHLYVNEAGEEWTPQELEELADYMIEQWTYFRAAICTIREHNWTEWREVFRDPFGIHGHGTQFSQIRHCRRCLIEEELVHR